MVTLQDTGKLLRSVQKPIHTQAPGEDETERLTFEFCKIDLGGHGDEFAMKVRRKATALQDNRNTFEQKLAAMLARNPMRMDYQVKYKGIATLCQRHGLAALGRSSRLRRKHGL